MPDDLYRPPDSDIAPPPHSGIRGEPGPIDLSLCYADGWAQMVSNFPLWLGAGVVLTLVMVLVALTLIGIPILMPVLIYGSAVIGLRMFDGQGQLADLFSGFGDFGFAWVSTFIVLIVTTLIGGVAQIPAQIGAATESLSLQAAGFVLSMAVALAVTNRLTFAYFFMVDQHMGGIDALRAAWEHTRGQTLLVVGLGLLTMVVGLLGMVALIIGVIPATVVNGLAWASAYRQMTGTRVDLPTA